MPKAYVRPGETVEYLDGQYRSYVLLRVRDPRLDPEPREDEAPNPPIHRFTARIGDTEEIERVGKLKRLDSWILDEDLDWLKKDRKYWKKIFQRAAAETFIPGWGVHKMGWDGILHKNDEVYLYWRQLYLELPTGDRPQHNMWQEKKHRGSPHFDTCPRTHARWIRILRFWIRVEHDVLNAGARRKLEDYPVHVQAGLNIAIKMMTKDLDFADNIRFAETGKPGEMRRFRRAREQGCCGSTERYVIIGTKQYIIGCNYGH